MIPEAQGSLILQGDDEGSFADEMGLFAAQQLPWAFL